MDDIAEEQQWSLSEILTVLHSTKNEDVMILQNLLKMLEFHLAGWGIGEQAAKSDFHMLGGLELTAKLTTHPQDEIANSAITCLWFYAENPAQRKQVVDLGGVELISRYINATPNLKAIRPALGLLRNLVNLEEAKKQTIQSGLLTTTIQLMEAIPVQRMTTTVESCVGIIQHVSFLLDEEMAKASIKALDVVLNKEWLRNGYDIYVQYRAICAIANIASLHHDIAEAAGVPSILREWLDRTYTGLPMFDQGHIYASLYSFLRIARSQDAIIRQIAAFNAALLTKSDDNVSLLVTENFVDDVISLALCDDPKTASLASTALRSVGLDRVLRSTCQLKWKCILNIIKNDNLHQKVTSSAGQLLPMELQAALNTLSVVF